jgi:hypothetical protein
MQQEQGLALPCLSNMEPNALHLDKAVLDPIDLREWQAPGKSSMRRLENTVHLVLLCEGTKLGERASRSRYIYEPVKGSNSMEREVMLWIHSSFQKVHEEGDEKHA